ncbi:MAG: PQQ-binding-like beta-propeller repeat protein [Thermotogota bacterium]|nr:PQQ-binding-like beta-propeller repeat protein [Thermotogota bacterium]
MKIIIVCIFALIVFSSCIPTSLFNENSYFLKDSESFSVLAASSNNEVYLAAFRTLYKISNGSLSKYFSFPEEYTGGFFSDPSLDNNDNILISANSARLMKMNSEGTVLWEFQDGSATETDDIFMSPSFDEANNIYFGTTGGFFYCLSEEGTKLWSIDVYGEIWTKPLIDEDKTVYFGTMGDSGKHEFLAVREGGIVWSFESEATSTGFYFSPAMGINNEILVACHDGYLYSVDSETGNKNWVVKLAPKVNDSTISASPVVDSMGNIFMGTNEGYFYCISSGGDILWKKNLESGHVSSAVLSEDGIIYLLTRQPATLFKINNDGNVLSRRKIGDTSSGQPLITSEGLLYYCSTLNEIGTRNRIILR